jgi:hypothetical protein
MLLQIVEAGFQILYFINSDIVCIDGLLHGLLLLFACLSCRLFLGISLLEFLYPTCRIDDLLPTGEKWVTL